MKNKIEEICNKLNREQLSVFGATEELLILFSASQQRELLLAYEKYTSQQVIGKENSRMAKSLVDGFLANNCG